MKTSLAINVSKFSAAIFFIVLVLVAGCKPKASEQKQTQDSTKGFSVIFFDVNTTEIKGGNSDSVQRLEKKFQDINLTDPNSFWPEKKMFYMNAMGVMNFPDSGKYYFRLKSSGKIILKINNVDLFKVKDPKESSKDTTRFIEKGKNIVEIEYYDGGLTPSIVLEWSHDGKQYEVVPLNIFSTIERPATSATNSLQTDSTDTSMLNQLTEKEKSEGWQLLFDGKTTKGWHRYNSPGTIGSKWVAESGTLTFKGRKRFRYELENYVVDMGVSDKKKDGGVDIVTDKTFGDFELSIEWKISKGGNSGIFYTVLENPKYDEEWKTSPEMQVLDNVSHKDGIIYKHRAGDLYDLIASKEETVKPYGQWNQVRIIKKKGKVEQWLNGVKVVEVNIDSPEWKEMISKSKFAALKDFATSGKNKIGLQDHDCEVWFRNIKIREFK